MVLNVKDTIFVRYCLIGQIPNQVKFMNTSTEHMLLCNQSEPLADASGRIVDLMNENWINHETACLIFHCLAILTNLLKVRFSTSNLGTHAHILNRLTLWTLIISGSCKRLTLLTCGLDFYLDYKYLFGYVYPVSIEDPQ